jgi:hypothetical protein
MDTSTIIPEGKITCVEILLGKIWPRFFNTRSVDIPYRNGISCNDVDKSPANSLPQGTGSLQMLVSGQAELAPVYHARPNLTSCSGKLEGRSSVQRNGDCPDQQFLSTAVSCNPSSGVRRC